MHISSNFDSGNIIVKKLDSVADIQLAIADDGNADFKQWFHFRLSTQSGIEHTLHINNVNQCSYVEGWEGYSVVASYDREEWFRVPTHYDGEKLTISHTPEFDNIYYAYFTPYSLERHQDLTHQAQMSPLCQLIRLGQTVDGRDLDMLKIEDEQVNPPCTAWIIARQHPGESMAEWCAEGFISRLLDDTDAVARSLLKKWRFFVVPNMNPDGSIRGHLRSNSAGANLNREWLEPSRNFSPEVFLVREQMKKSGCNFFLDLHGDEAIPYTFVAGAEGIPSYDNKMATMEDSFKDALLKTSPDFQIIHGYPKSEAGKADLSMASNWVAEQFHCLAFTLEMPFKDHLFLEDNLYGWSAERSINLGAALLTAINTTF
ncbi:MAG TPA: hypothetical protein ENJ60_00585 [Aeromonadales bacterium]|nr:hypothetical protein [Aeromonadales bacterium]